MPTREVKTTECTCSRCQHVWLIKNKELPMTCPGCRSPYWNRERVRKDYIDRVHAKKEKP